MSKFKVGDRVVVVDLPGQNGQKGEVTNPDADRAWPVQVRFDHDGNEGLCREDELEFEHVYDAPSSPAVKVESRDEAVNHPSHYAEGWSNGAEVIDITEHLNFNRGNAVKYLSRAGKKGGPEKELEDLQKALWYVRREVERLGGSVE